MRTIDLLAAFIGGAAVGAALGLLLAPEKGEDTRKKIVDLLREKGVSLPETEMEQLVERIVSEFKRESNE